MKKTAYITAAALLLSALATVGASAQTYPTYTPSTTSTSNTSTVTNGTTNTSNTSTATMPYLYNTNGTIINNGTASIPAGYYYLNGGAANGGHQVYYYGNGTYYDPTTQTYGGSVNNPNGTSGVFIGGTSTATFTSPGVPNTGEGGLALSNWLVLLASAAVFLGSMAYVATRAIVS